MINYNNELGKGHAHYLHRFLNIRKVNRQAQMEMEKLESILADIKKAFGERYRKKQRVNQKYSAIISDLHSKIKELEDKKNKLQKQFAVKEAELKELGDKVKSYGVKRLDEQLDQGLQKYLEQQEVLRNLQDDGELLPHEWDQKFKTHIQEMSTELKNSLGEQPSNKNFPGIKADWIYQVSEIRELEHQNRTLERSQIVQDGKLAIIKDIEQEINRIREKLKEGSYNT